MKYLGLCLIALMAVFTFGCSASVDDSSEASDVGTGTTDTGDSETGDTATGDTATDDTQTDDSGTTDETDTDEPEVDDTESGDPTGGDSDQSGIDVHGDSTVSCDGSPEAIRSGVVGRTIQCQMDHHDGIAGAHKSGDASESAEEDGADTGELGEPILYQFNPSAWDLDALAAALLSENADNTDLVLDYAQLTDFVYEQGLEDGINDSADVVRELSESFALDIADTTHRCVESYLYHYEVMLDCLDQAPPVLPCGEATPPDIHSEDPCADHNGTVADWVKDYVTALGAVSDGDERAVYESIMGNWEFSETVLERKITVADLRFYKYYYAKRDWESADADGNQQAHLSFLNPNNWAQYPLIDEGTEQACADSDVPRCCEYETFIDTYDSNPMDLLAVVNSCSNELEELGPYDNSQLYKTLLQHDGSVGNDGAFTIDEFFRPFILHYEKTTPPEHRGVCYWGALRDFAFETIQGDAGNDAMEMNAQDMDGYIQSYNATMAQFDGASVEVPVGVCEAPAD